MYIYPKYKKLLSKLAFHIHIEISMICEVNNIQIVDELANIEKLSA